MMIPGKSFRKKWPVLSGVMYDAFSLQTTGFLLLLIVSVAGLFLQGMFSLKFSAGENDFKTLF